MRWARMSIDVLGYAKYRDLITYSFISSLFLTAVILVIEIWLWDNRRH